MQWRILIKRSCQSWHCRPTISLRSSIDVGICNSLYSLSIFQNPNPPQKWYTFCRVHIHPLICTCHANVYDWIHTHISFIGLLCRWAVKNICSYQTLHEESHSQILQLKINPKGHKSLVQSHTTRFRSIYYPCRSWFLFADFYFYVLCTCIFPPN